MSEATYLIAIAFIEQEGKRFMPLGGKSLGKTLGFDEAPGPKGEEIALELLLRLFQRTEHSNFRRDAGDQSLVIVEMTIENMQENLPSLKSNWVDSGDTEKFFSCLCEISKSIWNVSFVKYQGILFRKFE